MSTPATRRIGYVLKRAQHAFRQSMDNSLRPLALTTPQYAALVAVEEVPGGSSAELARRCFVTPQTMNEIVRGLVKRNLLVRVKKPRGAKVVPLTLSPKGRALLRSAHPAVSKVEEGMLASLGQDARLALLAALTQCVEALEGSAPELRTGGAETL
jgi:DNA-binding MarR family transcriptional regulator